MPLCPPKRTRLPKQEGGISLLGIVGRYYMERVGAIRVDCAVE